MSATVDIASHRILPGFEFLDRLNIEESIRQVFSTPVDAWDSRQWITAAILLFLGMWCCGCMSQNRRSRRGYGGGGYYPNQQQPGLMTGSGYGAANSSGGGASSCLRNAVMCACCYELCCRDCQDIAPFLPGTMMSAKPAPETDYTLQRIEDREDGVAIV